MAEAGFWTDVWTLEFADDTAGSHFLPIKYESSFRVGVASNHQEDRTDKDDILTF